MFGSSDFLSVRENKDLEVMIVDDNINNLNVLSSVLREESYQIRIAKNGEMAFKSIQVKCPDIILLDVNMPIMGGFKLAEKLSKQKELENIPIIFITAMNESEFKVKGFNLGAVDFITKPFNVEEVKLRIALHLKLKESERLLRIKNDELKEEIELSVSNLTKAYLSTIVAMVELADARDDDTGQHIQRISVFCKMLANLAYEDNYSIQIDTNFISNIEIASPLHDIGKISIEDSILLKPGKLTDIEFERMKQHVTIGADKLKKISENIPENAYLKMGEKIARFHHEKWDGSGYCLGLKGDSIPIEARIMAISDVYDALRSARVYKKAYSHQKTIEIMKEMAYKHFDPSLFAIFYKNADAFESVYTQMSEVSDE